MKSYSSDCYNAGLFTILTVVLNEEAPGYRQFKSQANESWKNLGLDELSTNKAILKKGNNEELVDSLTKEFPHLLEKGYGEEGKLLYELGFWGGMLFLSLIGEQEESLRKSVEMLRYKCAELGNPTTILNFVKDCEGKISRQEKIDIMEAFEFTKDNHFWVIGNFKVHQKKRLMDVVVSETLSEIPYIGNALKAIYDKHKNK